MKVACILGVSNYKNCTSLPGCDNDVDLIRELLEATDEYEEICLIDGSQKSVFVKQQMVDFFTRHKGKTLDQALFYFTGHGALDSDEFQYILSDYDSRSKKQTVIENSELDNWLRMLEPNLTVKIVDACHAGVQYVKDANAYESYVKGTLSTFKDCYFLFSSKASQNSILNQDFSEFTKSFVNAVVSFQGTEIRFKDIVDAISDDFEGNTHQTPFFVAQGTYTEKFSTVTDSLRTRVSGVLLNQGSKPNTSIKTESADSETLPSILSLVKKDSLRYCSQEEVELQIKALVNLLQEFPLPSELSELYDLEIDLRQEVENLPAVKQIGKWLSENENDYFAEPTYEEEDYKAIEQVPIQRNRSMSSLYGSLGSSLLSLYPYENVTITKTRQIVSGFRSTHERDLSSVRILAKPKFPNLKWHDLHVTFVYSKTEIRFFYLMSTLREDNWDTPSRRGSCKWRMKIAAFKGNSSPDSVLRSILDEYLEHLKVPILAEFDNTNLR